MIIRNYSDDPSSFKLAWLDLNNQKTVTINFPNFKAKVTPSGNENPQSNGWYEHNDKKKKFVLTNDTTVIADKNYFQNGSLTYDQTDIESSNFNIKKSIQDSSNIDFMGCVSTSLEFSVANDFKFLMDQDVTVTLSVFERSGNQKISTIFGVFSIGSTGQIQGGFDVTQTKYVNELRKFDLYDTTFEINDGSYHARMTGSENYINYCIDNNNSIFSW